jgi:hypothetical protein
MTQKFNFAVARSWWSKAGTDSHLGGHFNYDLYSSICDHRLVYGAPVRKPNPNILVKTNRTLMRFIGQSEETDQLHATHQVFWESNIIGETLKAFQISVQHWDGSRFIGWVPKSKTLGLTMQDHNNPDEPKTKFFIPKFFIRRAS